MERGFNEIFVSSLFIEIFKNFNVSEQKDKMKELDVDELYYLLICCFDKHDPDDVIVMQNYSFFEDEIDDIYQYHKYSKITSKEECKNMYIFDRLSELTNLSEYNDYSIDKIKTTCVTLPEPYTKEEVRNIKLGNILDSK